MSGRWSSHTKLLWSLSASSHGQYTSAAESTIDSPPLQRTLSSTSLAPRLLELDRYSTASASAASSDFLFRKDLVNVLELISNELHNGDSSVGCSSWPTVCLMSALIPSDGLWSEFGLEAAFWRFDFFGRVKVLVSISESDKSQDTTCSYCHYSLNYQSHFGIIQD